MESRSTSEQDGSVQDDAVSVAEELRVDILSGRYPEGLRITESELTKRFGVGRGPVREAVQRLSYEGLLKTRKNFGAVVAPEAPKPVRAIIVPIRRTLELYALNEIFDDLREEDFEHWNEILEEMKVACQAGDFCAIAESDVAFHRYLLERLQQSDILAMWDLIAGRIRSHFRHTQRRRCNDLMELYDEHVSLLEKFRNGPLEAAAKLLKEKID